MQSFDFGRFICPAMVDPIIAHLRTCDHCRKGVRELVTGFPMLTMFLPGDKKKSLLAALDQLDKEAKPC